MRYRIEAESAHRIRIRLLTGRTVRRELSREEEEILQYAFSQMPGVDRATIYRATGGCALEFHCPKEEILRRLDAFRFENVDMLAREEEQRLTVSELKDRKLDPALKRKVRLHILKESIFDLAMPTPLAVGFHVYQLITLKEKY